MTVHNTREDSASGPQDVGTANRVKVSVVVAVYNTGHYIEPCIDSLLAQSLPPSEYEVIFVDDGSTDATPARLDDVARKHPNVSVIHMPNSGWPGKPRNVGIDSARGEYVYFLDHDDWLAPEALERMYAMAKRHGSDVVIGKIAGHGRRVPRTLFRQNYERCDLLTAPLMESMTPHKAFRRAFLNDHGLRFPEGKRRLEDHVFVVEAYLRANVVSVLSDYTCYHHTARNDGGNAGFFALEPVGYYANLREAIDIVERLTQPGELRDLILRRWYRVEMLRRVSGKVFLAFEPKLRRQVYAEVRKLALERFTSPGIWEPLGPQYRVASELLRADRYQDLLALAQFETSLGLTCELRRFTWDGDRLRIEALLSVRTADGQPALTSEGGVRLYQGPAEGVPRVVREVAGSEPVQADLQLRLRESSTRHVVPLELVVESGECSEHYLVSGSVDPVSLGGRSLDTGVWDLFIRLREWGAGPDLTRRVGRNGWEQPGQPAEAVVLGSPPFVVAPYWTLKDNLSLEVREGTSVPQRPGPQAQLAKPPNHHERPSGPRRVASAVRRHRTTRRLASAVRRLRLRE